MQKRKRSYSASASALAAERPYKRPMARRSPRGELKFFDNAVTKEPVLVGGDMFATVNGIAQGTGENQRIGRRITIRSVQWRWVVHMDQLILQNTPNSGDNIRLILFIDKQCNGAGAAVIDILETLSWQSFRNLANSDRFDILMDKQYDMAYLTQSQNASDDLFGQSGFSKNRFFDIDNLNIPIEFDGTDGLIGEITSNNISIMVITQAGKCNIISTVRVRFTDN